MNYTESPESRRASAEVLNAESSETRMPLLGKADFEFMKSVGLGHNPGAPGRLRIRRPEFYPGEVRLKEPCPNSHKKPWEK